MKKAKIYMPSKTAMQSGKFKSNSWILEFVKENLQKDFVMGWNSSTDTGKQVKIYFDNKDDAIRYAKKNDISFDVLDPKKRKIIIKSYADNFIKN
jgi:hypothetical protein